MFAFIEDRRVEDVREEPFLMRQLFLQPRDHVAADHDVHVRERLLDHLAERQARDQLHLRADRDADDVRPFLGDRRQHELIADIAVDVHLLVVETGQEFLGDAGPVAEVAFHRIEHERSRIVGGGDVLHRLAEGVQRPFELVGFVELLAPHDPLRLFGARREIEHVDRGHLLQHRHLARFLVRQLALLLFRLQRLELHRLPGLDPDQELGREEVVVHLDVDVALDDLMAGFAQHGGQRRQRQIGRGRHPLGRKQQHDLGGLARAVLGRRQAVDLKQIRTHDCDDYILPASVGVTPAIFAA